MMFSEDNVIDEMSMYSQVENHMNRSISCKCEAAIACY